MTNADTQPAAAESASIHAIPATPASRIPAIAKEVATAASVTASMSLRLSTLSAAAPATNPRKKNGAMDSAADTPTRNSESDTSNTSQPTATQCIP